MPVRCGECGRVFDATGSLSSHKRWCESAAGYGGAAKESEPREEAPFAATGTTVVGGDHAAGVNGASGVDGNEDSDAAGIQLQLPRPSSASLPPLVVRDDASPELPVRCAGCGRGFATTKSVALHKRFCRGAPVANATATAPPLREAPAVAAAQAVEEAGGPAAADDAIEVSDDSDDHEYKVVRAGRTRRRQRRSSILSVHAAAACSREAV